MKQLKTTSQTSSRLFLMISSLLMIFTFYFPLWKIQLWAPQYPEGLELIIWSNKLSGDITTINILNHSIGMALIDENLFPELKTFPFIFNLLIATGLLFAVFGKRWLSSIWTCGVLGFATWSLYDFYAWNYKFGRNLSPDAPIKMDDMIYQPPLIGEKVFLNITVASWPQIAGIAFTLSVLLAIFALIFDFKLIKTPKFIKNTFLLTLCFIPFLSYCTYKKPEHISYGKDSCHHCKMLISDKRFGAEIVTKNGKIYKFDAIECLSDFEKDKKEVIGDNYSIYISDTTKNGELIPIESAFIFEHPKIHSPMGRGYMTSSSEEDLKKLMGPDNKFLIQRWSDLKNKLEH